MYYLHKDGTTVSEVSVETSKLLQAARLFTHHPDDNPMIRRDHVTNRYVFEYKGRVINY